MIVCGLLSRLHLCNVALQDLRSQMTVAGPQRGLTYIRQVPTTIDTTSLTASSRKLVIGTVLESSA